MENVEPLIITTLTNNAALQRAKTLKAKGIFQQHDKYCYLKIDDDYIHLIHPMLNTYDNIDKPAYFTPPDDISAHISIICNSSDGVS